MVLRSHRARKCEFPNSNMPEYMPLITELYVIPLLNIMNYTFLVIVYRHEYLTCAPLA